EEMSVAENVALVTGYPLKRGLINWTELRRQARQALRVLELDVDVEDTVGSYPMAIRAGIAIARSVVQEASIVVLDEPTASLPANEAAQLFNVLTRLRARGTTCLLISHRSSEILDTCDRVTVLRDGLVVATENSSALEPR